MIDIIPREKKNRGAIRGGEGTFPQKKKMSQTAKGEKRGEFHKKVPKGAPGIQLRFQTRGGGKKRQRCLLLRGYHLTTKDIIETRGR